MHSPLLALILFLPGTLAGSSIALASAERTCSGEFTDMRVIGLTLGDCDLNNLSANDLTYVKRICGQPWTPDSDTEASKCTSELLHRAPNPSLLQITATEHRFIRCARY